MPEDLSTAERIYYRDRMRESRYAALEDAEGFHLVCYALEELGVRLLGEAADLYRYGPKLQEIVDRDASSAAIAAPTFFSPFPALFRIVRNGRNDAMHTGAYARHVTGKAIELCLLLEDALMNGNRESRLVRDYMVKEPMTIEPWHPVARARQLMLTHSFSNLPIRVDGVWYLLTERGLARYLLRHRGNQALGVPISEATAELDLVKATEADAEADIGTLLASSTPDQTSLWIVVGPERNLIGVISAFELM